MLNGLLIQIKLLIDKWIIQPTKNQTFQYKLNNRINDKQISSFTNFYDQKYHSSQLNCFNIYKHKKQQKTTKFFKLILMGNQQNKASLTSTSQGQGVWFNYLTQVQSSQASQIAPFYKSQISYIQKLFRQLDKSNTKSLQLSDLKTLAFLSNHPFKQRIITLFQQQLTKIKTKKISLQIFYHLLSTFHIHTPIQQKCKYLFRLYDCDKDFKINHSDLVLTYRMIFRDKIIYDRIMNQESIKNMASQTLVKYGTRGQIKLEQFVQLLRHDQINEVMAFLFSKNFQ